MTNRSSIQLAPLLELSLGSPVGQLRAAPVELGPGAPRAMLAVYAADFDVDPYVEMFFFPTDTLKLALFTDTGEVLWRRDLGRGVVPGVWFCPVLPFDLDGDGVEEIWFVNNVDAKHPLGLSSYRLERLDARTGATTGQWHWPSLGGNQSLSHTFRNFIIAGRVKGEPVLVTAQGTYEDMFLQAWRPDMSPRWEVYIPQEAPGARGSHMCPITDLDGDGVEELMWGERCIELDGGTERFCADRDVYRGHSDIIQPLLDRATGRWFLYTCREGDARAAPRVALFDDTGRRVWGALDEGHMDMGWVARLGPDREPLAMAIRIGHKTCGPDGRFHQECEEFTFNALTGTPHPLPFRVYQTVPVDLDGDGYHELVRGVPGGDGEVLDRHGRRVGSVGGPIALASKLLAHPGEQVLSYHPDGTVRIWGDRNASDTPEARERYAHPFYRANIGLGSTGSNLGVLAGV
jgi:hypothetical protein